MNHITSLLLGLGNGAVYAALALALVLTYRSSGVINFATGTIALYTAYVYSSFRDGKFLVLVPGLPTTVDVGRHLGFVPAALLALAVAAVLGALLYLVVFRSLRDAPPLARTGASLGVLIVIQGVIVNRVGEAPVSVSAIFPAHRWQWGSVTLLSDRFYLAVAVVALALALTALLRWTRFGLLTRAVAETRTGALVSGVSPERIALFNWMLSAVVAGAAGILIAPISPLSPTAYTLAVVPALAAAVVGRFELLLPAVAAGLVIGMLQSEAATLSAQHSWFPQSGSAELVPLIVILGVLLLFRSGIPVRGALTRERLGHAPRPRTFLVPTIAGAALGIVALALTHGTWRSAVIGTFIAAIISLSLVVVTGYAGQVSLAQLTLAGVGGFALSGITQSWGVPFPIAPLLAAAITTVVGVLVGLPALRLRGITLGVVTLAFAYALEAVWFRNDQFVKPSGALVTQPHLFGIDLGVGVGRAFPRMEFGLLCLLILIVVAYGVARLRTSSLGSAMLAVRANERAAMGIGVDVVRVKIAAFALASFIAGVGGSLLAYKQGVVTFTSFTALGGLALLATAYLAGITSVSGGLLGGVLASSGVVFLAMDRWLDLGSWFTVIVGVALIAILILFPEGLAASGQRLAHQLRRFRLFRPLGGVRAPREAAVASARTEASTALSIEHLTVTYGGVVAVDDVSLQVAPATVVGLIGPNGAGKTSVIDAVTGFAPAKGSISLRGENIDGLPAYRRVRMGLGRTFQSLELYDDLTVEENVAAAVVGGTRHGDVSSALERTGISDLRDRHADELSQGERQLVSIARALARNPDVLLLDEPAAGLDTVETKRLSERIRDLAGMGTAVVLVDHDIAFVLATCGYIHLLDFGKVVTQGPPESMRADPIVAEAYLGGYDAPVTT
ncbi:MAG TPA: branched-chain amino acid ABC transporter permease/ATP-binding protein [Acidimicrobiia bacterium]|jgi:ABC-type branched-subunit amino acid transport system ATPase component/ABC-type branched-subunit amino acid transport system permease subunit